jgi:hypothetical protein
MARPSFSLGALITRRSALATAAAVSMSALACFPAGAQQSSGQSFKLQSAPVSAVPPVTINTDCSKWQPGVLMANTKCEILKGEALDAANAAASSDLACRRAILVAAKGGKITLTAVPPPGQACKIAKEHGLS